MKISTLIIFLLLALQASAASALQGTWLRHPGFHRQVERIIDTPERTYLHLHQQRHLANHDVLGTNRSTIFYIDHNSGEAAPEINALAALYPEMPVATRYASYNPAGKYLAVACENNELWIVPDQGAPYAIHGLDAYNYPGLNHVISLEFSREDPRIWIGTTYGYAVADPEKRIISEIRRLDRRIDWIVPVGETVVAISDSIAYTVDAKPFHEQADLKPLKVTVPAGADLSHAVEGDALIIPEAIMPLTSRSFAFFTPRSGGRSGRALCAATRQADGTWSVIQLADDEFRATTVTEALNAPVYACAIPNRDGYYLAANNYGHQLLTGIDPDPAQDDPVATFNSRLMRRQNKIPDNWRPSGSWDLSRFIFFQTFYGWYTRTAVDSQWGDRSPYLHFNGPSTALSQHMLYHPDYGLLAVNPSVSRILDATDFRTPLLVSALRDNRWGDHSPILHTKDEKVIANFSGNPSQFYPVTDPDGIAIDPADPSMAFSGSFLSGWARYNLADPSEIPLHVGSTRDYCRDYQQFYAIYPIPSEWSAQCAFSNPGFDAEGRLWMLYINSDLSAPDGYPVELHYYTPDDLQAIRHANTDEQAFRSTRKLAVTLPKVAKKERKFLTLRHPANRNLLVVATGEFRHPIAIVDHNGTPENPDDDRVALFTTPTDQEARRIVINYVISLWENPDTGELFICTSNGVYGARPSEAFDTPERLRSIATDLQSLQVNAICADPLGRLWIGTESGGLFVTDATQTRLDHHFTSTLSPLPDDRVIGLCYNPERRSVMISTDLGMAEFFPDDLLPGAPAAGVRATPATVAPSYPGAVTFAGLTPGAKLTLTAPDGQTAATATVRPDGTWQWEGRQADGRRSPRGLYRLSQEGKEVASVRVI